MKCQISKFILLFLFVSCSCFISYSNVSTPYETIFNHLDNLQKDNYHPEQSSKSINPAILDGEAAEEAAIKLKQVLDGKGIYIYMNQVPNVNDYKDSMTNQQTYTLSIAEPSIYVEKVGDKWYYSEETMLALNKLYKQVYPFGTRFFKQILPQSYQDNEFLGIELWKITGSLSIIIFAFFLYLLLKKLVNRFLYYLDKNKKIKNITYEKKLEKFARTLSLFIIIFVVSKFLPSLQFDLTFSRYLIKFFVILLIFMAAIMLVRLVDYLLLFFVRYVEKTSSKLDDQLLPIVKKIVNLIIWILAISFALKQLNVNLTAIIAGLSIGGLALALASQDTVKNLIGSITIFIDHPFEIDDYILIPGLEGTVEEVGMRATRIRTPGQSLAYVPNGELSNMIIDNWGLRIFRRWNLTIGVEYGTSPETIAEFCERATTTINSFDFIAKDKTNVNLNELGASSLNIFAMIYIDVQSYNEELVCKHKVLLELIKLANEMKVEFAFPTQTLHVKNS